MTGPNAKGIIDDLLFEILNHRVFRARLLQRCFNTGDRFKNISFVQLGLLLSTLKDLPQLFSQ